MFPLSGFLIRRLSSSEVYKQVEWWLTTRIKNVLTLWQHSLQYLIPLNQNHARHLPSTSHLQKSFFSLLDFLLQWKVYIKENLIPGALAPFQIPAGWNQTLFWKLHYKSPLVFLSPPHLPSELVRSVQLSNSPGEDQPSFCGRQTSMQVLINARGFSWEKAAEVKGFFLPREKIQELEEVRYCGDGRCILNRHAWSQTEHSGTLSCEPETQKIKLTHLKMNLQRINE